MSLSNRGAGLLLALSAAGVLVAGVVGAHLQDERLSKPGTCPSGSHLVAYEDGSGACYWNGSDDRDVVQRDGHDIQWPENTFHWDCRVMGNNICGPDVLQDLCGPIGDECPSPAQYRLMEEADKPASTR